MIIQLEPGIDKIRQDAIVRAIHDIGYKSNQVKTQAGEYLICIGKKEFDIRTIGHLPGVSDLHRVSDDYKLVSRKWKVGRSVIDLGDGVKIGGGHFAVMAGPCSIENEMQVQRTVRHLAECGVRIMRGGVYKPRSSPYSFRGLGMDGLKMFAEICHDNGIKIISEVMQVSQVQEMYPYIDVYQVGARNSQNYNLLDALGEVDKPVLIKRGISGSIEELLHSAEYVFSAGNERILVCERGIRSYETAYRNTLDLNAVPVLHEKTHLPVIVDPSHGIGIRRFVEPMALAAVAAGADGLLIEMHETPDQAMSDGYQCLNFPGFKKLMEKIKVMRDVYQV